MKIPKTILDNVKRFLEVSGTATPFNGIKYVIYATEKHAIHPEVEAILINFKDFGFLLLKRMICYLLIITLLQLQFF